MKVNGFMEEKKGKESFQLMARFTKVNGLTIWKWVLANILGKMATSTMEVLYQNLDREKDNIFGEMDRN